jgi:hypothetical protein
MAIAPKTNTEDGAQKLLTSPAIYKIYRQEDADR